MKKNNFLYFGGGLLFGSVMALTKDSLVIFSSMAVGFVFIIYYLIKLYLEKEK